MSFSILPTTTRRNSRRYSAPFPGLEAARRFLRRLVFPSFLLATAAAAADDSTWRRVAELKFVDGGTSFPVALEAETIYRLRLSNEGTGFDFVVGPLDAGFSPVGIGVAGRSNRDAWLSFMPREPGTLLKISTPSKRSGPAVLELEAWSSAAERDRSDADAAAPGSMHFGKLIEGARAFHPVEVQAGRPLVIEFRRIPKSVTASLELDLVLYDESLRKIVGRRHPGLSLRESPRVVIEPEISGKGVVSLFGRSGEGWYAFSVDTLPEVPEAPVAIAPGAWVSALVGAGAAPRAYQIEVATDRPLVFEADATGDEVVYRLSLRRDAIENVPGGGDEDLVWYGLFGGLKYQQTDPIDVPAPGRYTIGLVSTRGFGIASFRIRAATDQEIAAAEGQEAAGTTGPRR